MSLLTSAIKKLQAMFGAPTKPAVKAWQESGGEAAHAFWLYATPVNMMLGRDSFFLAEPAPLPMTGDESLSILTSLNEHFSEDGYHFYCQNAVWFVGMDVDPVITTTPVEKVVNNDIEPYLPKGDGALAWATLQNEIQMLLFNHPVNVAREAQGQPVMNSLWCYGEGAA
jgi:hypothetical protein